MYEVKCTSYISLVFKHFKPWTLPKDNSVLRMLSFFWFNICPKESNCTRASIQSTRQAKVINSSLIQAVAPASKCWPNSSNSSSSTWWRRWRWKCLGSSYTPLGNQLMSAEASLSREMTISCHNWHSSKVLEKIGHFISDTNCNSLKSQMALECARKWVQMR